MFLTLGIVLFPLVLGQLVTSLRAGMADDKWPTHPLHLFHNYRISFGYIIEHSHRIAGFTVGGVISLLTIGLWLTDPCRRFRWLGVVGIVLLLVGFGDFHRRMQGQENVEDVVVPQGPVVVMGIGLLFALIAGIAGVVAGRRGAGLRLLVLVALVAVMIQGLLGGLRVLLNAIVGPDLAAIHGVFAQMVFSLLVALTVLSGRRTSASVSPNGVKAISLVLVALLFVQLVFGVLVRHMPTPGAQRLHFLTAFIIVGVVVWLVKAIFASPAAKGRAAWMAHAMSVLVLLQVALGVEAWMGKFGSYVRPEMEVITTGKAAIRTSHVLIGTLLLGSAVAAMLRLRMQPGPVDEPRTDGPRRVNVESDRDLVGASQSGVTA